MKTDGVYIYSIVTDDADPLMSMYSYDLLFQRENNKLKWLQMSERLRLCTTPRTKDNEELFDSIEDFLANPPKGFDIKLDYKYKIIKHKLKLNSGEYYKNIYRPVISQKIQCLHLTLDGIPFPDCYDDIPLWGIYREEYLSHIRQLELIFDELKSVFIVLEPTKDNLKAYGNAIRNIIFLSCSEIDMMMKKILKNNGFIIADERYTTKHYFKLKKALRLGEYKLKFKEFEHLGSFSPFSKWKLDKPTQSLVWYDAYNKIKHDREANFKYANMENALTSISAYAILLLAQYGYDNNVWDVHMRKFFSIQKCPRWKLEDCYLPPSPIDFIPKNYPFK